MTPTTRTSPNSPPPLPGAQAKAERTVHVIQGGYYVTGDPGVMLTTIVGSCVTACLRDPVAAVGGMNHFLLPGDGESGTGSAQATSYGVHAMEVLINGLLRQGARRENLEARLFGGGRMLSGLTDVGAQNAAFAERFLSQEGITSKGGSLRGNHGRRVQFWPVPGRARALLLRPDDSEVRASERSTTSLPVATGSVELF